MSRSRRHTPIMGTTTARSEKYDKRLANRALRRETKMALKDEKEVLPIVREVSNKYDFAKDGFQVIDLTRPDAWKWMRK